ncbi:MAG TPA: hypothetical protein VFQ60_00675, partial [Patescibacteria group bacterium]|nr:hypothetical protein [Patescibacteria group bacterium]
DWTPYLQGPLSQNFKELTKTKDGKTIYALVEPGGNRGCLAMVTPDRQVIYYSSLLPDGQENRIAWNQGYPDGSYSGKPVGGCGAAGCEDIIDESLLGPASSLVQAGQAENGDPVYVPRNASSSADYQNAYQQWYQPNKPSYEAFIKDHPNAIFYWRDAAGRMVRYELTQLVPQAECGKPVIYLYPTETTNVRVALAKNVNVTKSDPAYKQSWSVLAHPDGSLDVNGKIYPSLYWEGTGIAYEAPKNGFIVKAEDIPSFLDRVLPKYGLDMKEAEDFKTFWVPKLIGAPYFRISFLTSAWSAAAPLYVSPAPKTMIRLFMDWSPLSAPISLHEPVIRTPVRQGFTLVEWGGQLFNR